MEEYSVNKSIRELYDNTCRTMPCNVVDKDSFMDWKHKSIYLLKDLIGINKMTAIDLNPVIISEIEMSDHIRIKMYINTELHVKMPFYILKPKDIAPNEKRAVVIALHGHLAGAKDDVAGVIIDENSVINKEKYNSDFGLKYVRRGYVVFCPDMRGAGERKLDLYKDKTIEQCLTSSCMDINFAAISMGTTFVGMQVFDLKRLIDYIETLDFCDAKQIGCVGFSGGGLMTLWLTLMDDRIGIAGISGYFYNIRNALLSKHRCGCNFIPRLWNYFNICDLLALIAPKSLIIEVGDQDTLNSVDCSDKIDINVIYEQFNTVQEAYRLLGINDRLRLSVCQGGHKFFGSDIIPFFDYTFATSLQKNNIDPVLRA